MQLQGLDGGQRAENSVAVISAAPTIQLAVANDGRPGIQVFFPPGEFGLLIKVSIQQYRVVYLPRDFSEKHRGTSFNANDFDLHAGNILLLAPFQRQSGGVIHMPMLRPVRIKQRRLVGDFHVITKRWNNAFIPRRVDKVREFFAVHNKIPFTIGVSVQCLFIGSILVVRIVSIVTHDSSTVQRFSLTEVTDISKRAVFEHERRRLPGWCQRRVRPNSTGR